MSTVPWGCWLGGGFWLNRNWEVLKEKGRFSASGVGLSVPLLCCSGKSQRCCFCGVPENPWQGRGLLRITRRGKLCFHPRFPFPQPQPSMSCCCLSRLSAPLCRTWLAHPWCFRSWDLTSGEEIVCHCLIFNLFLCFCLLLHSSEWKRSLIESVVFWSADNFSNNPSKSENITYYRKPLRNIADSHFRKPDEQFASTWFNTAV